MGAVHIRSRTFTYHKKLLIFDYALLHFHELSTMCRQSFIHCGFFGTFFGSQRQGFVL